MLTSGNHCFKRTAAFIEESKQQKAGTWLEFSKALLASLHHQKVACAAQNQQSNIKDVSPVFMHFAKEKQIVA